MPIDKDLLVNEDIGALGTKNTEILGASSGLNSTVFLTHTGAGTLTLTARFFADRDDPNTYYDVELGTCATGETLMAKATESDYAYDGVQFRLVASVDTCPGTKLYHDQLV
jgi:hypothetical protein